MSSILSNHPPASKTPESPPSPPAKRTDSAGWNRRLVVAACLLLGISGATRYWREFQFLQIRNQSKDAPFPLKELPMVVGSWRALEGVEATLDPEVARIAGSSDYILRTYVDEATGERATVLVLYGLASIVWSHTPDICYPAVGFQPIVPPRDAPVTLSDGSEVPFREALYGKSEGGSASYQEVYYSFRNAGEWRPLMSDQWKRFRSNPGMFKIQIERRANGTTLDSGACNGLLAGLVEAINERTSNPSVSVASTSSPAE